jgi:hypothetical protein
MRKKLLINPIHLHKVIHARQEHIDLDDLLQRRAGGCEDRGEVLDAELGHLGDGGGWLGQEVAGGRAWDLAGAVDG